MGYFGRSGRPPRPGRAGRRRGPLLQLPPGDGGPIDSRCLGVRRRRPDSSRCGRTAAAEALRLRLPSVGGVWPQPWDPILDRVVAEADGSGRSLFSANRQLDRPGDPVEALWQSCTALREHRGDGHVAMLTSELVSMGVKRWRCSPPGGNRPGGTPPEPGLVGGRLGVGIRSVARSGSARTPAGSRRPASALRRTVEEGTDRLAARPYQVLDPDEVRLLNDRLGSAAEVLLASGVIPFPNPIGLPPPSTPTGPSG